MNELLEALSITAAALSKIHGSRNVFEFVRWARVATDGQLDSAALIGLWRMYSSKANS